jgi:hypothetical protein
VAIQTVIQKEVLIMLVDFNSVDGQGRLLASLRHTIGWRKPKVGDWVRLDDTEGHTCRGRVDSVQGRAIKVVPEWDTLITYVPTDPTFSVSYSEEVTAGVQESAPRTEGWVLTGSLS